MDGTLVLPVDAIREGLNADPEFVLQARFWTADIRFVIGSDQYFMRIENGRVVRFKEGTQGFDPYDVNVAGPEAVWREMLAETPRPFYHDWLAAQFHHEFELSGDRRRLRVLLRPASHPRGDG